MDFLVNDLSLHGQFSSAADFIGSVDALMAIRQAIRRSGRDLFCHRGMRDAQVTADLTMPQAVQGMPANKRRAWLQWLTNEGPHWQDERQHSSDDWLENDAELIVTDHAIGEAAYCQLNGKYRELVSIDPSEWLRDPITVTWRRSAQNVNVNVTNHWSKKTVTTTLASLPKPFDSWESLQQHSLLACDALILVPDAFKQLEGYPYVKSVAEWIWALLHVLNQMQNAFDKDGNRTSEFELLYETYFKGEAPYFTDESDTNKRDYKAKLTFPHPTQPSDTLFCPWHGKVNTPKNFPPIRIHFTWPAAAKSALYVVHVGPKITMR